jgi:hypothetical protein
MVKTGCALLLESEDADGSTLLPRFCFQHTKEIMGPSGYYLRKNGEWVNFAGNIQFICFFLHSHRIQCFSDWIPAYLQAATQVSLRIEMEKARSNSDIPGYIYTFEIHVSFLQDLFAFFSMFNPLQKLGNLKLSNSKLDDQ